jgi:hypothetical protein
MASAARTDPWFLSWFTPKDDTSFGEFSAPEVSESKARLKLPLARVPRPYFGDGLDDECLQHRLVHISQFLDVEAALADGVLAELGEQRL